MTRERLRQFDSLVQELVEEQERLARELRHARRVEETCGVGCLFGMDYLEAAKARVQELSARREDEVAEIRIWVERIPDSLTRRAFKLRFLDGLPWGRDRAADGIRLGQRAADAVRAVSGGTRRLTKLRDLENPVDTRFESVRKGTL